MVSRKDFLTQQQAVDKQMIRLFKKSAEEVNMLFLQAVEEGDITKAKHLLARINHINQTLKREYGEWVKVRIPQEYALGADYIDWEIGEAVSIKPKAGSLELIAQRFGPIHKEAVQALVDQSTMLVHSSIDKIQSNILYQVTKVHNINIKEKLAVGMIQGKSGSAMKQDFLQELRKKGVSGFKDRAGKFRTTERYADMVVRTETRIANVQGTINRGLELGITKYKVTESSLCCSVCANYNGKVYDMAKGSVELPPYHPNCYHKDTKVMTDQGWKYFWELTGEEKCLSINPINHQAEYVPIKGIVSHYASELISFKHHSFDLEVSPNHSMVYVSDRHYHHSKKMDFALAEEVADRKAKYIPRGIKREGQEVWSDAFVRFMAMYMSEGSVTLLKNGKWRIKIAQDKEKSPEQYARIMEVCKILGYHFYALSNGIEMNDEQELASYLHTFGKSYKKYLPKEIKNTSRRQLQVFLEEYLYYDGHKRTRESKSISSTERLYFTTSPQMMSDLCECIAKAGGVPSVRIQQPKTIDFSNGIYTQNHQTYVISYNTRKYADVRKMQVSRKLYNDMVWCVELEKYHTLYVMYNGKVCISGNCKGFVSAVVMEKIDHINNHIEALKQTVSGRITPIKPTYENPYKNALAQLSYINSQLPKGLGNKDEYVKKAYKYKEEIIKNTMQAIDRGEVKGRYTRYYDPKAPHHPTVQLKLGKKEWWYHLPKKSGFVPKGKLPVSPKRRKQKKKQ